MKMLSLNCRGLRQPEAVRDVRSLCELHRLMVVFLSETHFFLDKVDGLRRSLDFANGGGVGSRGRGGGLALLWTDEVCVKLQSYDKLHIDVAVLDATTGLEKWRFSGFYGEARRELRHRSWECLKMLNDSCSLPWLCVGDFNEILHANEQIGGARRSERQMEGFCDTVSVCGFNDLGYIGLPYTWDNR